MQLTTPLAVSLLLLSSSLAYSQEATSLPANGSAQTSQSSAEPTQEQPQPQSNPAAQANLPNAPSSLITAKPHGQGQIPLEDIPHPEVKLTRVPLNIVGDTYRIFTSPVYLRKSDLKWIVPLGAAAAVSFSQDSHVARDVVSHDPDFNNTADNVSYDLLYGYVAGSVTMYGAGLVGHNDRLRETGLLSGEAEVDAEIFDTVVKLASFRERPNVDNYSGRFYQTSAGTDSSFISGHAITTWAAAGVIAAEYPSPWAQTAIYTGAAATSLTRVLAEKHFPTDVLLGSAAGWLIGHYVVRAHHHHFIYRHHEGQTLE